MSSTTIIDVELIILNSNYRMQFTPTHTIITESQFNTTISASNQSLARGA